jgi:hypothetical protein
LKEHKREENRVDVLVKALVYTIIIVLGIAAFIGVMCGLAFGIVWLVDTIGKVWLCVCIAALIFVIVLLVVYFDNY